MFRGAASKVTWVGRPWKALALALVMVAAAILATSLLLLAAATRPAEAAFPGTNGKIVSSDGSEIYVMNADGSGETALFAGKGTEDANPAFSPDGSRIAFARNSDIWMGNADGCGTPTNVATNVANAGVPGAELDWGPLSFDLSLVQPDSPDPVKVGENLTYTLKVTNDGFDDAPGVVLIDRLPPGVTFVSASTGCTQSLGKVTCNLGTVAGVDPKSTIRATVTKTITVTPTAEDTITNTASVESSAVELIYTANNSDRERTEVTLNRTPVANEDSYVTTEDTPLAVPASGVLADDTDADGDRLQVSRVVETTSGGTLALGRDGSFTYAPNSNFNSADAFTYAATDGTAESNAATVTIVVRAVNDPPNAANDSAQTEKDTPLNINVLANDRDPERDEISITNVSDPAHGTATLNSDGTVRYAPEAGYTGSDPFTYTVSDGNGGTDTGTVTITVSDTKAPTATNTTPTNKATGVSPTANVTATFSEVMKTSTINGTTFTLKRGTTKIQAKVFLDPANNRKWILDPSFPLARGTTYVATVTTGAQDLVGNTLDQNPSVSGNQPKRWSFTVRT